MKLYWITLFISSSLLLHTATAIPGLRYFRSSVDNRYRIRDAVPENEKLSDDVNESPPNELGNSNGLGKVLNAGRMKLQRPMDAVQGLMRPEKLRRTNPTNEELPSTNILGAANDNKPISITDIPTSVAESSLPQQTPDTIDVDTKQPTDVDPPSRQPAYPDQESNDGPAFTYPEFVTDDEGQNELNQVSPTAITKLRQFVSLTSVLANIARIPRTIALQIDSVMAGLQNTYPTNTNVGAYLTGTRFLLRNQIALKPFDLMDRAGLGRLDTVVSTMPSVFNPLFNAIERYFSELIRRITTTLQRVRESARRVTERARSSLSGMNVARNNDSYSLSVPDFIDMVLKGRLASALDGYLGLLQRGLVSSLSGIGNSFSPSAPVVDAVRNQGYGMRSANSDYLRPIRYYD